ncbi:hypothetical protein QO206_13205 [Leeuwenhoekiella aequorea]|uniref:hypothetical protein n=1 Tax=Leeuwenhoekiella aequorea TaxID=283736 RepID=UPI00352D5F7D
MAKELPYFKFEPNQWENGNIQFFNRELKGLFIDLCSMYWSRLGDLDYALALQKLCNGITNELDLLMQREIFIVENEKIVIEFLDEQLEDFQTTSKKRVKAARKRWGESKSNANALQNECKSNAIREEKRREDKIIEDKKRESNSRALKFLELKFPSRFQSDFLIKHKSQIKNFEKFCEDFNDTVDQEGLEFTDKILFARLGKYARNWIQNQSKFEKKPLNGKSKTFETNR